MKKSALFLFFLVFSPAAVGFCADAPLSEATQECLECHALSHPGIVAGWRRSRHAAITPREALGVKGPALKISAPSVPEALNQTAVGCAECHTLRSPKHSDTVEHNGYDMHVVVSPDDCATCHATEAEQYRGNIMAHAYRNLAENSVYQALEKSILGRPIVQGEKIAHQPATETARADACYYCHGTRLEVTGFETRESDMGAMQFAKISGWPNQGVGRINLDGSTGSCSACHARHTFSIEMARKPYTCKECHVGPDVPAFKVYTSSKHGNLFSALNKRWNFDRVPWTIGRDFTAPTCAACHVSLLVNAEGDPVAERTHRMDDRLAWRIFGLIYAHPHPREPDVTGIRNKDGLPLPTDFGGGLAPNALIDDDTRRQRTDAMQAICRNCHDASWVRGHWQKYETVIKETDDAVKTATGIMADIWGHGFARGLAQGANPFDEAIERSWTDIWLFYANTIRFSAAMAGGGDFGVFADGRYHLSKEILHLKDWLEIQKRIAPAPPLPPGKN